MAVALTYGLGDIVTLKKPHACGENRWCIIRMGMDIRVKCTKCDHSVLIPRQRFDRILRKVLIPAERTLVSQEEEND
ncbi:DUF951 domain-containing protein [Alicyclobacillus mengziensis]|uniref:DUF951 domain-containing protein n=1 Tax=Alicyclobacillus mengziensis TaxID=2931921 RepID=A0A9X7VZ26_9BACL|nr:DUF951 domain-containing protein [Alicyclobacillus mengziensis]